MTLTAFFNKEIKHIFAEQKIHYIESVTPKHIHKSSYLINQNYLNGKKR